MPLEVDVNNLPPFPTRIPEKLKTIRERLGLSPDEIAPRVGAKSGAEILEYESEEGDQPVSILWAYARLAGNPMMNLIDDSTLPGGWHSPSLAWIISCQNVQSTLTCIDVSNQITTALENL